MRPRHIPDFAGQVMAVERVGQLLRDVTRALDARGIPYALIGGNAVAAWVAAFDTGAVRATKDVDLLIREDDLVVVSSAFNELALARLSSEPVTFVRRADPNPRTGVHIVYAGQRIRAHYPHPAPEVTESVRAQAEYAVIDLPALVAMKLQAFRDIDRVHLRDLMSVNAITPEFVAKLPPDLQQRYHQLAASPT